MPQTRTIFLPLLLLPLLLLPCLLLACSRPITPVRFSEQWPAHSGDYESTTDAWTRRGILRSPLADQANQIMEIYATALSTEWRAAYVARQVRQQTMGPARQQQLRASQEDLATSVLEFELLAATYHPEHNDLHRANSIWTVTLVADDGTETIAAKVEKERRPNDVVAGEFRRFGDFFEAYRVSFPYSKEIWRGKKFSLRISSSLGTVEVQWLSSS